MPFHTAPGGAAMRYCVKPSVGQIVAVLLVATIATGLTSCDSVQNSRAGARHAAASQAAVPATANDSDGERPIGGESREARTKGRYVYFQSSAKEEVRRIIYEAEINLVVKSMSETE